MKQPKKPEVDDTPCGVSGSFKQCDDPKERKVRSSADFVVTEDIVRVQKSWARRWNRVGG